MIALDTNMIVAALVKSQAEHPQVAAWLQRVRDPLGMTGTNLVETLRLLTHPRVFPRPLTLTRALDLVSDFMEQFDLAILEEAHDWWMGLKDLLKAIPGLKGNEIFDARIALCLRHNGVKEIATFDADFSKYSFLEIVRI